MFHNSMELHDLEKSMEFRGTVKFGINKFHISGSVFYRLLPDFMLLYIRQSNNGWNIEIPHF